MATIKELKEKTRKIHNSLKTVKSDSVKKNLKDKLKTIEREISAMRRGKTTASQRAEIKSLVELVNKTKSLKMYKGSGVSLTADANRQAKKPGYRISKEGNRYYEGRPNRSDIRQSGRYPRLEHGGELHRNEYAEGGEMNNHEYAMSKVYELEHHIEEIKGALEGMNDTEAWMIGRLERASLDLSDVTHTLLSEEEEPEAYESDANDNFEEEAEEEVEDVTED